MSPCAFFLKNMVLPSVAGPVEHIGDFEELNDKTISYNTVELMLGADELLSLQDACHVACLAAIYSPIVQRGFHCSSRYMAALQGGLTAKFPALSSTGVASIT